MTVSGPNGCKLIIHNGPWHLADAYGTILPQGCYLTLASATWNLEIGTHSGPVQCSAVDFDGSDKLMVRAWRIRAGEQAPGGFLRAQDGTLLLLDDLRRRVQAGTVTRADAEAMLTELERLLEG